MLTLSRIGLYAVAVVLVTMASASKHSFDCSDITQHRNAATTLTLKSEYTVVTMDFAMCPLVDVDLTIAVEPRTAAANVTVNMLIMTGGSARIIPAASATAPNARINNVTFTFTKANLTGTAPAMVIEGATDGVRGVQLTAQNSLVDTSGDAFSIVTGVPEDVTLSAVNSQIRVSNAGTRAIAGALSLWSPAGVALVGKRVLVVANGSTVSVSANGSASTAVLAASVGGVSYSLAREDGDLSCTVTGDANVSVAALSLMSLSSTVNASGPSSAAALSVFSVGTHANLVLPELSIGSTASFISSKTIVSMHAPAICSSVTLAAALGVIPGAAVGTATVIAPNASLTSGPGTLAAAVNDVDSGWRGGTSTSFAVGSFGVAVIPEAIVSRNGVCVTRSKHVSVDLPGMQIFAEGSFVTASANSQGYAVALASAGCSALGFDVISASKLRVSVYDAHIDVASKFTHLNPNCPTALAGAAVAAGKFYDRVAVGEVKLPQSVFSSDGSSNITADKYVAQDNSAVAVLGAVAATFTWAGAPSSVSSAVVLNASDSKISANGGVRKNNLAQIKCTTGTAIGVASFVASATFSMKYASTGAVSAVLIVNRTKITVQDAVVQSAGFALAHGVASIVVSNVVEYGFGLPAPTQSGELMADAASISVTGHATMGVCGLTTYQTPGVSAVAGFAGALSSSFSTYGQQPAFAPNTSLVFCAPNARVKVLDSGLVAHSNAYSMSVLAGFGSYVDSGNTSTVHSVNANGASVAVGGKTDLFMGEGTDTSLFYAADAHALAGLVVATRGTGKTMNTTHAARHTSVSADDINIALLGSPTVTVNLIKTQAVSVASLVVWAPECLGGIVETNVTAQNISITVLGDAGSAYVASGMDKYPTCQEAGIIVGGTVIQGPSVYNPGAVNVTGSITGCPFTDRQTSSSTIIKSAYIGWYGVLSPLFLPISVVDLCASHKPATSHIGIIIAAAVGGCVMIAIVFVAMKRVLGKRRAPDTVEVKLMDAVNP